MNLNKQTRRILGDELEQILNVIEKLEEKQRQTDKTVFRLQCLIIGLIISIIVCDLLIN